MKRKKTAVFVVAGIICAAVLCGCGSGSGSSRKEATYKDGTYEGKSSEYEGEEDGSGAGYGVVTLTISGGKISDAEFKTYELDGTLKDKEYGKQNGEVANQDFYNKAQRAVQASAKYGEQLASTGNADEVDAITGATISYNEFKEAVEDALNKAAE